MMDRMCCPECDSPQNTEQVFLDRWTDEMKETMVCYDCDTQWTNHYDLYDQTVDDTPGGD